MGTVVRLAISILVPLLLMAGCDTTPPTSKDSKYHGAAKGIAGTAPIDAIQKRPNILLLLVDDMGYGDFFEQPRHYRLPSIAAIAKRGVSFPRHYTHAVCSPSRASLLTGLSASALGYRANGRGVPEDVATLPGSLRELGYETFHVGKWHMGHLQREAWPDRVGFEHWFGFLTQNLLNGAYQLSEQGAENFSYARPSYINPVLAGDGVPPTRHQGHLTDILTDHTVKLIRNRPVDRPWFINHWFYAPHQPLQPAPAYVGEDTSRAGLYRAQLAQLDHSLARIMTALADAGELSNTVVVLTSDNGGSNRAIPNNRPLTGSKGSFSEGALRVPLVISLPDRIPKNSWRQQVASLKDIYPTLMALAGGQTSGDIEGISLLPLIEDNDVPRRPNLYWEMPYLAGHARSALSADGQWRYTAYHEPGKVPVQLLFDLHTEPAGLTDVAGKHPQQLLSLASAHQQWAKQVQQLPLTLRRPGNSAGGSLTGRNLQRLPGFGEYSFAISFAPAQAVSVRQVLAHQPGVWQLAYTPGDQTLHLRVGRMQLRARIEKPAACHSVLFAGTFRVQLNADNRNGSAVSLYLDGQRVAQDSNTDRIDNEADFSLPTWIGRDAQAQHLFRGMLSTPRVFNTLPTTYSWLAADVLHNQGCSALVPAGGPGSTRSRI